MIKILVNGARGKVGVEIVKAVQKETDLKLVGEADVDDKLKDKIWFEKPDVVVDFTHPNVVKENVKTILEAGCHAVVGTTGLREEDLAELGMLAKEKNKGLIVCPNFAIGAVLMMKYAAEIGKYMPTVEIIELHHDKKVDSPSGTAIKTAEMIQSNNKYINHTLNNREEKELYEGARGAKVKGIPIHSVRLPGYVAHQEVIFGGLGQTLTLRHDTISRESFMPGVIIAVRKVVGIKGLVYGLENLL
jgi:4-hydroxy-tetrahydrodipicolinate reductase